MLDLSPSGAHGVMSLDLNVISVEVPDPMAACFLNSITFSGQY